MRIWEVREAWGIDNMVMAEQPEPPPPAAHEIMIRVHAASINYRDVVTILNTIPFGTLPQIPLSDCAGEVVAAGEAVTRFRIGDRVCPSWFPLWIAGPPDVGNRAIGLGSASAAGVLQERIVMHEDAASLAPAHLNWREAATLPCAGLTAWRALIEEGNLAANDIVLVQGTGGVSMFALQFAKMRGATVIATSSSDSKLDRAQALGADHLINYVTTPDWGAEVLRLTHGRGVDHIVEVGGGDTINQSIGAAAVGARIYIIGVLGGRSQELLMPAIFNKNLRLIGVTVGSRTHFEAMAAAIDEHGLRPVVDRVFSFDMAPDAVRSMKNGGHFGKIVIDYND